MAACPRETLCTTHLLTKLQPEDTSFLIREASTNFSSTMHANSSDTYLLFALFANALPESPKQPPCNSSTLRRRARKGETARSLIRQPQGRSATTAPFFLASPLYRLSTFRLKMSMLLLKCRYFGNASRCDPSSTLRLRLGSPGWNSSSRFICEDAIGKT